MARYKKIKFLISDTFFVYFFDKTSVELFVNDGELVMTNTVFPREVFNRMTFYCPKGNWTAKDLKIYPIL